MKTSEREFRVYRLEHGTVIDHIPHWSSLKVVELLGLRNGDPLVTLGIGLQSDKLGRKDLVKIEGRELTAGEVEKLALVAPQATINLIRGGQRVEKLAVNPPEQVNELVRCANSGCITRHEEVPTRFQTLGRSPLQLRCYFCGASMAGDEIELL